MITVRLRVGRLLELVWRIGHISVQSARRVSRVSLGPALTVALVVAACGGSDSGLSERRAAAPKVSADAVTTRFGASECSGGFVPMDLDHVTSGPGDTASTFDGTGSGVALGDLDNDGDLDIVLANLSGSSTLLLNTSGEGGISFETVPLIVGRFRHVAIVDVDGDQDRDIVMSTGLGTPVWLRNDGGRPLAFERTELPGVRAVTYSMAWADLGGDGDMDLVTGSYNAEITQVRNSPLLGSDTGVLVYDAVGGVYEGTRIASEAQALAIKILDLTDDGLPDIIVGNDLASADGVWIDNSGAWLRTDPFPATSFSTMSLDSGDYDNDGDLDIFSTDMLPMVPDGGSDARYAEVAEDMAALPIPDDIQRPENVLVARDGDDYANVAPILGIEASGWSWSGVFGDLDSDGWLDLYIVNGMRSDLLFAALPDARLVEPNQAFRNRHGSGMSLEPRWGLADEAGGRGMAMGDMDGDGDLDIIVNNLDEPARLFKNEICGGADLIVDLKWTGELNSDAVGSTIVVTSGDQVLTRTIDVASGYLSGGPTLAHFGLGEGVDAVEVSVFWPDGGRTDLQGISPNRRLTLTRNSPIQPPA